MEEIKRVYKPLVETSDGRLISIWAGNRIGVSLEYKEGGITYNPEGGAGIWVCDTLEEAICQGRSNASETILSTSGILVVYEAISLGERVEAGKGLRWRAGSSFAVDVRYPAILLGKEIWREKPKRPKPKFKVGDKVQGTGGIFEGNLYEVESVEWDYLRYEYKLVDSSTAYEENLELAPPEPEWVDVTKECKAELYLSGSDDNIALIVLKHNGTSIFNIGNEGRAWKDDANYDIRTVGMKDPSYACNWFRVFRRK